jgi:hypothetical protein
MCVFTRLQHFKVCESNFVNMGSTSNQENEHVDCEIDGMIGICATQFVGHRKPWY